MSVVITARVVHSVEEAVSIAEVERRLSERDLVAATLKIARRVIGWPLVVICPLFAGQMMLTGDIDIDDSPPANLRQRIAISGLLLGEFSVGIVILNYKRWIEAWRVRKEFRRRSPGLVAIQVTATERHIEFRGPIVRESILWDTFTYVVESRRGLLLFERSGDSYWLPSESFDGDPRQFARLARRKVNNYKKFGRARKRLRWSTRFFRLAPNSAFGG
jgi:hypothetical protein